MGTFGKRHFHNIKLSCLFLMTLLHSCMLDDLTLDEIIELINKENSSWKAGRNNAIIPKQGGVILQSISKANSRVTVRQVPIVKNIPKNFDAREKWPDCGSIRQIRDQKNCGGCWAFSAASVMSDRICIQSKGKEKFEFSTEDLLTCCSFCGNSNGCLGGSPIQAFTYWETEGVVSGGDYDSHRGCKPYSYGSFELGVPPNCSYECTNQDYQKSYVDDKHYGNDSYFIVGSQIKQVQSEIITNGPVVGLMEVYEDFEGYKTGVYVHKKGKRKGNLHGIRIIGWGVENDVPYWLVANSWGTEWGNKGFFKILKGSNQSGIEMAFAAGTTSTTPTSTSTTPTSTSTTPTSTSTPHSGATNVNDFICRLLVFSSFMYLL